MRQPLMGSDFPKWGNSKQKGSVNIKWSPWIMTIWSSDTVDTHGSSPWPFSLLDELNVPSVPDDSLLSTNSKPYLHIPYLTMMSHLRIMGHDLPILRSTPGSQPTPRRMSFLGRDVFDIWGFVLHSCNSFSTSAILERRCSSAIIHHAHFRCLIGSNCGGRQWHSTDTRVRRGEDRQL